MSFCSKCGEEIIGDGNFCQKCGAPINGVSENVAIKNVSTEQQRGSGKDLRSESLSQSQNLYDYFIKKSNEYNQLDILNAKINTFSNRKKRTVTAVDVVGVIIVVFVSYKLENVSENAAIVVGGLLVVLASVAGIVTSMKLKKKNKEDIKLRDSIASELTAYYNAYNNCPIGIEFSNPKDINLIMNTIRSGRADTISAAINIILDDEHKANMERKAGEIAQATAETAKAAKAAAGFSFLNLFK